jgi:hypothetical protein
VSWKDAAAFCEWLSAKEGKPYRLPTEAEWEYACRAGTITKYWTGNSLPIGHQRNQWTETGSKAVNAKDRALRSSKGNANVSLRVAVTPVNPWGLYAMHGNVEEWVYDWYGPHTTGELTDPIGPADGMFKVTRGGSHNTSLKYLRSANRSATLPTDMNWLIGFRVVQAPLPKSEPGPAEAMTMNDLSVKVEFADWSEPLNRPVFHEPIPFVRTDDSHPVPSQLTHHHCPTLTWCANGDLLAAWYATISEIGREMVIASSRLRHGRDEKWAAQWDVAQLFFGPADRNTTGTCLMNDGQGRLYFFNAIGDSGHHRDQCLIMSTSEDSGRTWARPRVISDLFRRHKYTPMDSAFVDPDGTIVLAMDYAPLGFAANEAGSGVFISQDQGATWYDRITGKSAPQVAAGNTDSLAAGFHINVVRLKDGRLLAMTRTQGGWDINGHMTQSYSTDEGQTWTYRESPFPGIGGGQRLVLKRLAEGPLMLISFAREMEFTDSSGTEFTGHGMFAALSFDEGETWPVSKLLTAGGPRREIDGGGNTGRFVMDSTHAETRGYLAVAQTPDHMIHLISSRLHYRFNLAWLEAPNTPAEEMR